MSFAMTPARIERYGRLLFEKARHMDLLSTCTHMGCIWGRTDQYERIGNK
jgi:hypothetical protein